MSRAEQIRQWISTQDGPQTFQQIADGVCEKLNISRDKVSYSIHDMVGNEFLLQDGSKDGPGFLYSVNKDRVPGRKLSPEDRLIRRRKWVKKSLREERLEHARAAVEAKAKRKAEEVKRKHDEALRIMQSKVDKKGVRAQRTIDVRVAAARAIAEFRKLGNKIISHVETVDEFVARGGVIQVLPPGNASQSFEFSEWA